MVIRIRSLPNLFRNVKRWSEILSVLSKYGLADWLAGMNVDFVKDRLTDPAGEVLARITREARIRLALTELGPTFIKLGQLLSTRPDVVGKALADELRLLQTDVPADSPQVIRALVEKELGQPIDQLFTEFDDVPIASASIGQVHKARLPNGHKVVVKVQHAGIEAKVNEDLEVLAGLAYLAEQLTEFQPYRPVANVADMARTLRRELEFGREERNLSQFAALFADDPTLKIPKAYSELSTSRVLTMDYLEGIRIIDTGRLIAAHIDVEEVARRGSQIYMKMIFMHGFYHADPHPGNLVVLEGNVIGLLDFGMVGRIDERLREHIEEMLVAIVNHDVPMLTALIKRIGQVPHGLDEGALANDVADFVGHYATQSLSQFDMAGALNEIVEIIRRFRIILPTQVALLIKVLITLEGTTKLLSPKFSVMEVMQPFRNRMMLRRLSPQRQMRKLRRLYLEFEQILEVVPRQLANLLEQIQDGKFDVHLDHRGLGPSTNRLVLGMLSSALFLGSSWMLANKVPPLLFPHTEVLHDAFFLGGVKEISILGLSGCCISLLLGLRLIQAIGKSGHLDQKP